MTIWFAHCFVPGPGYGLVYPVLSSRARSCRRDHQAPSAPLPDVGVTFVRETLLSGHRSYEHMCQSRVALLCFGSITSFEESLQVATSPCCHQDLLDVMLRFFPWVPGPLPRRSIGCMRLLTSPMSSAFPLGGWVGFFPLRSTMQLLVGTIFEAADIPLCSGPQVCSPPRLLPPLRLCRRAAEAFTSGQNVLRCLRTHRIC